MTEADGLMHRIFTTIALAEAGHRDEARRDFSAISSEFRCEDHPLHMCILAHYMADLQDDLSEELSWDLRALEASRRASDVEVCRLADGLTISQLRPSLHLNLADAYLRSGAESHSATHVKEGLASIDALPEGPYKAMVRRGLDRIANTLKSR
jgi:hypothetical protein